MAADETAAASRPKRVRTGCLTCRERHLKCDEAAPDCNNCRKSNRECKRGIRLNFIDITIEQPPIVPISHEWNVRFEDESREIASEYVGGSKRYDLPIGKTPPRSNNTPSTPRSGSVTIHPPPPPTLPPILPFPPNAPPEPQSSHAHHRTPSSSYYPPPPPPQQPQPPSTHSPEPAMSPAPREQRAYLDNAEETLFMQVFVEEVGIWMDSLDPLKHFSRLLPFNSLGEPMLLNAFLACGARHLTLVNPAYHEDKALNYYDTATRLILLSLQNQNRDTEMCATTAIILNVYEIMSEKPLQRMNHIAGARALLKECGWNARTKGVGGACFWLNVSMELLSCLRFNWAVAWDPDSWGVDMDFSHRSEVGREELWAHRIIYILAKIANLKAALLRHQQQQQQQETANDQQLYNDTQRHYDEWRRLRDLCTSWNEHIPRNMHPMAYLHPYQTAKKVFPEVWLIKRCAIVARLFYHTAMVILPQINPYGMTADLQEMALSNAHQICGIAAHVKDRGVASVALRSLHVAAECLTVRREQEAVLEIFSQIKKETGWRVNFVYKELKERWGWEAPEPLPQPSSLLQSSMLHRNPTPPQFGHFQQQQQQQQQAQQAQQQQQPRRLPMVNPLMAATDLTSHVPHPYYPHYVSAPPQQVERHHYL